MQTHSHTFKHTHKHANTHTTSRQSAASASPPLGQHHHHHHTTSTASSTHRWGHCSPPCPVAPWGCCHPCPASAGWRAGCPGCCSADRPACTAATCNNRPSMSSLSSALVVSNPQIKGGSEGNRFPPSLIGLLASVDVEQQKLNRFPASAHTMEHVTCHIQACAAPTCNNRPSTSLLEFCSQSSLQRRQREKLFPHICTDRRTRHLPLFSLHSTNCNNRPSLLEFCVTR